MVEVIKKKVNNPCEKSGCDFCDMNIYVGEEYYLIVSKEFNEDSPGVSIKICELCKPKFIEMFK